MSAAEFLALLNILVAFLGVFVAGFVLKNDPRLPAFQGRM
jgi:hypothetical protein